MSSGFLTNKDALKVASLLGTGLTDRKLVDFYHATIAYVMETQRNLTVKGLGVFRFKAATAKRHAYISFKPSRGISNDPAEMTRDTPFDETLEWTAEQIANGSKHRSEEYCAAFLALCALKVAFVEDDSLRITNGGEFRVTEKFYGTVKGREVNGVRYVYKHHLSLKKPGDKKPGPSKRHTFGKK